MIKKVLLEILLWTWCLPQTLLGLVVKLIYKGKPYSVTYFDKIYHCYNFKNKSGSISLGKYILLCNAHKNNIRVIKHEYGHFKQSLMLGWLYLVVIGLPSFVWANWFSTYRLKHNISYYSFFPEKWADKLGGVGM